MKTVFAELLDNQLEVIQMYRELIPFIEDKELKTEFIENYKHLLHNHRDMLMVAPAIMQDGLDADYEADGEITD